jgi:alkanesulfonate monooxygenase SsuD/methylene tetrahydromethanopterin reductase-like flavin-dependent oxidoreductase (luciferase family)
MRLGLSVASRSGLPAARFAELAAAAEHAGFDAFLVAERVADSFALCQAALAATTRITVGTAVANARLRHPVLTGMTAATVDELYGGRFLLGLGISNPALNEGTLGLSPVASVSFMRDYVAALRRVLAGDPAVDRAPARPDLPVFLAGLQPRMLRLAGEIADGVVLNLTTPRTVPGLLAEVAAAGREVTVAAVLPCALGVDRDDARRAGRELVVGYALHPAAGRLFAASGYLAELTAAADALRAGDRAAALALVNDAMVDDFLLSGDERQAAERIRGYQAAGVHLPILFPIAAAGQWDAAARRTIDIGQLIAKEL